MKHRWLVLCWLVPAAPAAVPEPAGSDERRVQGWFNRVDGAYAQASITPSLGDATVTRVTAGYSWGREDWSYGAEIRRFWGQRQETELVLSYDRGTRVRYQSGNFGIDVNSIPFLLGQADYFDYYHREGRRAALIRRLSVLRVELTAGVNDEDHRSLDKVTDYDLLGDDPERRPNPPVEEGSLRSVDLRVVVGDRLEDLRERPGYRIDLRLEHSPPGLGSDFDFTQVNAVVDWKVPTSGGQEPRQLDVRVSASTFQGRLPPQRFGALDVRMWQLTPIGGFKTARGRPYEGDRHVGLFWEHDFRSGPVSWIPLMPPKARLVVYGASGRTWVSGGTRARLGYLPRFPDRYHHEVGVAVRVHRYARVDFTRRLDEADWSVGVSVAFLDYLL